MQPTNAATHPAPAALASALADAGLTVSLSVARQDGKPLDSNDLVALRFIVGCHDQEHAAPVSDDGATRIALLATPAPLAATGSGGE
jgi:hypothetical protein